jgi:hypothetical protein
MMVTREGEREEAFVLPRTPLLLEEHMFLYLFRVHRFFLEEHHEQLSPDRTGQNRLTLLRHGMMSLY